MAAPKRTHFEREDNYVTITRLYLKGHTQQEIADELKLSRQQIGFDLKTIQKRWRESTTINIDEAKERELSRIDELERTYWEAWEKSCGQRTKTSKEATGGENGRSRASVQTEEMLGNPAYLSGVMSCIQERSKILGIYAPEKKDVTAKFDFDDPRDELLSRMGRLATRSGAQSGDSGDDAG